MAPARRKWWIAPAVLILLVLGYLAAGYWLVPRVLRSQAVGWTHDRLHKRLALGEIRFDPLRFTLDIDSIAVDDPTHPMVALGHLHLKMAPLSVFEKAWHLPEVGLDRPAVDAIVRRDGSLNLAELIPPSTGEATKPLALRIDRLTIAGGQVAFADLSLPLQPRSRLEPVTFTLKDLRTSASGSGDFTFAAASDAGERFDWRGRLSLTPLGSTGSFAVADLRADTLYRYLSPWLPVIPTSGKASAAGRYAVRYAGGATRLGVDVARLGLADVGLDGGTLFRGSAHAGKMDLGHGRIDLAIGSDHALGSLTGLAQGAVLNDVRVDGPDKTQALHLAEARLDEARLDYGARRMMLGALHLSGLEVPLRRSAGGAFNLARLMPPYTPVAAKASRVKADGEAQATPSWYVHLADFALTNGAVLWEDHAVGPTVRMKVTGIDLASGNLDTDMVRPLDLRFAMRINGAARLSGEGTVAPRTGAGQVRFDLAGFQVGPVLPYLPSLPGLVLRSGKVGAKGVVTLAQGWSPAGVRFVGDASLDGVALHEAGTDAPLVAWNGLALSGLRYAPSGVDIAGARLNGAVGRIAIMADRTFNFSPLVSGATPAATPAAKSDAAKSEGQVVAVAAPSPVAHAVSPSPVSSSPALPIRLHDLALQGGTLNFADYSISPSFEARIDALHGHVRNITNSGGALAAIDLQGQVNDRYSPVTLSGTMDPFHYDRASDVQVAFSNIELPMFNPYSGVYAGYSIAKGKLSTRFTYHIANRALQAEHHVIVDQLQWGQASANKARVSWPVRLATALLKDSHGVIRLDVPVRGTLDDPTFRLGPIIWKIIGNVITKAVTAPFRFLGSLFAGAEKAQFVDFAPGSAQLPDTAGESLTALGKGLADRPALNLDIPAGPGLAGDAKVLADRKMNAALMVKPIRKGQPVDFAALAPADQEKRLKALFKQSFHQNPDFAGLAPEAKGDDGHKARVTGEIDWLRDHLRKGFMPGPADLEALGRARGTAIRDALVTKGGIDPIRLFLSTSTSGEEKDGTVRFELKLR
ncbi:hypothetical protein Y88_3100 [Novosphingobium nitrogenifigens DSM 19370]|uniref:DUF748 domain-containing protein n=2 Tax=Novosphingobium nitrogenifigens TaxID=378548 RepID=F1ZCE4_9SPHN|nr:DUF748 domain-containing protein [Novosphingobium nitrogenifigens]EGD57774.1 hypothetical protein Y88_3100 [Novosphingobium nitrogenifigens DSM 19370]